MFLKDFFNIILKKKKKPADSTKSMKKVILHAKS